MPAVRVAGDPLPSPGFAPGHELGRVQRPTDQVGAVEGVGLRARAVVARVLPIPVAAAVLVRLAHDLVGGRDDRDHLGRRAHRRDRQPVGPQRGIRRPARRGDGLRAPVSCSAVAAWSTWPRSVAASSRVTRPSTGSEDLRSQRRTRRRRARPYWPSTVVLIPYFVRKPCSTRTSVPRMPWRRSRSPKVMRRASAVATGSANTANNRPTQSVRQRDKTISSFRPPTGLAVGLARKASRYTAYCGDSPPEQ